MKACRLLKPPLGLKRPSEISSPRDQVALSNRVARKNSTLLKQHSSRL